MASPRAGDWRVLVRLAGAMVLFVGLLQLAPPLAAAGAQPPAATSSSDSPFTSDTLSPSISMHEIRDALVRLPLAAVLGAVLALRPRKHTAGPRSVLVIQTQIMLAVVGAVIMLVVGNSLSRAFGIVGAAGLVRYRSTIDDPKEAVVMLCALGAGLASGVGLYVLAPFATVFMTALLWLVEFFEPAARKHYELTITNTKASDLRPKAESALHGLKCEYELLAETDELVSYSISAPLNLHTRDVSDMLELLAGHEIDIEWKEKKGKKK